MRQGGLAGRRRSLGGFGGLWSVEGVEVWGRCGGGFEGKRQEREGGRKRQRERVREVYFT
jgi:hypothetical protein